MDGLHKALKWIDHNRYLSTALVVALLIAVAFAGCQPTTQSVLNPGEKVTAVELQREAAVIKADYKAKLKSLEVAKADLEQQYELRQQIVGVVGALGQTAAGGGLTPTAGIAGAVQLLTLAAAGGALVDNRRKDKIIKAKSA